MNKRIQVLILPLTFLIFSCSSSVSSVGNGKISSSQNVYVKLVNSSDALSQAKAKKGSRSSIYDDKKHKKKCLENFTKELSHIGLKGSDSENGANTLVEFSLGNVRFDANAGWIADHATAKFIERNSGSVLREYKAKAKWPAPSTEGLINNLTKSIKKDL